jgi:hypothetical protein
MFIFGTRSSLIGAGRIYLIFLIFFKKAALDVTALLRMINT